jgi:uncharacterized protein YndB with AHSA1/START domain
MTVIDVKKDPVARTLTFTARFDAPVARVWQVWADPRQLERWWGPPNFPATFADFDLAPGHAVSYFMTGPEGERYHGWWRILSVEPPRGLVFEDGFADDAGRPNPDMPTTTVRVRLDPDGEGTRMRIESTFPTREAMEQLDAMGMVEGMREAMSQIPGVLAAHRRGEPRDRRRGRGARSASSALLLRHPRHVPHRLLRCLSAGVSGRFDLAPRDVALVPVLFLWTAAATAGAHWRSPRLLVTWSRTSCRTALAPWGWTSPVRILPRTPGFTRAGRACPRPALRQGDPVKAALTKGDI